jgi:tetratricopeptide (TPR) repeat protein
MADGVDTTPTDDITLAEQALLGQAGAGCVAALERLRQADPARYWQAHERVLPQLAMLLRAGENEREPDYFSVFNRLADHLLLDDPAAFAHLIAGAGDLPLRIPSNLQLLRFYEGLAFGLDDHYAEALVVLDALLASAGLDEQVRGRALNTRANYCRYTGRLEEALDGYGASLALWRRLDNRLREGLALLNLGITYYDLRDYGEAESNLSLAIRCFEDADAPAWIAAAHNELGLVYRDQGRWMDALTSLLSAAAHYQAQQAHEPLSRVRNNIGEVLLFQGQIDAAAVAFQEALAEMHTRTYAVDVHLNLGLARQISGDMAGALAAFQDALSLTQTIGRQDALAQVHYRLGDALRRMGRNDEALAQFVAGAEVIERTREPLHDESLKISLMGRWQQVYEALVLHCLAMDRATEAFAWAERARARAFADALVRTGTTRIASAAVATVDELQTALPVGTALLCYFTTGVLEQDQPLLGRLPPNSALREHLVTPARTLLFCVTGSGLVAHTCPLDPNAFASSSPRKDDSGRFLGQPVLRRLFDWLLAPAGAALAAQRLTIIAHGPLHRIPFGALTGPSGRPLTRAGGPVLSYAPSATVLLHLLQV